MPELERALREVGHALDYPPTPELAARVASRLHHEHGRRRGGWTLRVRPLAVALAVLALALGTALAIPPARSAILDFFRLRGATIERVETLPAVRPARLDLGERVSLDEAHERAGFPVLVPSRDGYDEPDAVYFRPSPGGGAVSLLYGSTDEVRLLLTQFRGVAEPELVKKVAHAGTRVKPVAVDGEQGFWIEGAPHAVVFRSPDGEIREDRYRLATSTLLWNRDGRLLRLEADISLAAALLIAESLR